MNRMTYSLLWVVCIGFAMVSSAPQRADPDAELVVRVPPSAGAPNFSHGSVVGEVVVFSPNVAVKRSRNKNKKEASEPRFSALVGEESNLIEPDARPGTGFIIGG